MPNKNDNTRIITPEKPFPITTPMQLRFNDIDMLGHVNNTSYFELFDLGKNEYFKAVRHGQVDWTRPPLMIVNINIDFIAQTHFDEPVAVRTQTTHIGNKSITMLQQLINTDTLEVKAQCQSVLVHFNVETGVPCTITEAWRNDIQTFENQPIK